MDIQTLLVAAIPAIASIVVALIEAKKSPEMEVSQTSPKPRDSLARVLAFLSLGFTMSLVLYWVLNPKPPIFFAPLETQPVGAWFEVPSDGFVQVRVGGNGGSVASIWCGREREKTGNRILEIGRYTSDTLLVREGDYCLVERVSGSDVAAYFHALQRRE